ncbi:hypothetical protein WA026_019190 [Henosepilachna vigintioctopunctata]|uniref:Uncharacterized protein n=1 Tax=Henosepilachna vigintioctopunctata TaxID=420089 RepID=A0AAW1UTU4_9CUCU
MNKEENRKGIFPPEYYAICSYNFRNKKKQNWFCNKPLSPVESGFDSSQFEENDTSLKYSSDDLMTRSNQSEIESIPSDDFVDSDYVLSNSGTSSEVSSQSSEIFRSPEKSFENSPMEHTILKSAINEGNEVAEEDSDLNKITKNIDSTVSSKKSVFCYYCESIVTNFPRHILRNHSTEVEVMRILSLPTGITKPVRKGAEKSSYLPCSYCLGFYSARNLWRHRKQCDKNTDKIENPKNAQADAQNFLIRHLRIDPHLKAHVFPRMRADEISLIAKRDPLICAFASRFLKIKRSADSSLCASRKMRELARLLKEAKIIEPHINNLISALKPQFYDTLVSATKKVFIRMITNEWKSLKSMRGHPTNAQTPSNSTEDPIYLILSKQRMRA